VCLVKGDGSNAQFGRTGGELAPDGLQTAGAGDFDAGYDNGEVWVAPTPTSVERTVWTFTGCAYGLAWSPDSRQLVVRIVNPCGQSLSRNPPTPPGLWILNADGSDPHLILADTEGGGDVAWSPATKIAYTDTSDVNPSGPSPSPTWLRVTTPAGGRATTIATFPSSTSNVEFSWSPDSRKLLTVANDVSTGGLVRGDSQVETIPASGGRPTVLIKAQPTVLIEGGAYSPDGSQFVVSVAGCSTGVNDEGQMGLWEADADGSRLHPIGLPDTIGNVCTPGTTLPIPLNPSDNPGGPKVVRSWVRSATFASMLPSLLPGTSIVEAALIGRASYDALAAGSAHIDIQVSLPTEHQFVCSSDDAWLDRGSESIVLSGQHQGRAEVIVTPRTSGPAGVLSADSNWYFHGDAAVLTYDWAIANQEMRPTAGWVPLVPPYSSYNQTLDRGETPNMEVGTSFVTLESMLAKIAQDLTAIDEITTGPNTTIDGQRVTEIRTPPQPPRDERVDPRSSATLYVSDGPDPLPVEFTATDYPEYPGRPAEQTVTVTFDHWSNAAPVTSPSGTAAVQPTYQPCPTSTSATS